MFKTAAQAVQHEDEENVAIIGKIFENIYSSLNNFLEIIFQLVFIHIALPVKSNFVGYSFHFKSEHIMITNEKR